MKPSLHDSTAMKLYHIPLKVKWDKDKPEVINTISLILTEEQYQKAIDIIHRRISK